MKILRKITGAEAPPADADNDLLFQDDEELDAEQLDSIIESTARHYGVNMEQLKKHGVKSRPKRQAILSPNETPVDRLWTTKASIKWYYDEADIPATTVPLIQAAFDFIEEETCLYFKKDKTANPRIQFVNWGTECSSPVGFHTNVNTAGIYEIKIPVCLDSYGTIAHEILHMLGIYHQQARSDRDSYLDNFSGDIRDEVNSNNFGSPYDYGSVLHYGKAKTTDELHNQTIGNRRGPTFTDIAVINQRYKCLCKTPTVTCLNGGYPNPNDCDTCICPHGYGGRTCSGLDPGTEDESEIFDDLSDECETFQKSIGTQNNVDNDFYKKTWYKFQAPAGKKVQFIFVKAADAKKSVSYGCDDNGVEFKMAKSKFNRTGYVFCGKSDKFISEDNDDIKTFTSTTNVAFWQLYAKKNKIDVIAKYRYVDSEDDEVPSSCFPLGEEGDCDNIDDDVDCRRWNTQPGETCDDDPEYMHENCPKTCNTC